VTRINEVIPWLSVNLTFYLIVEARHNMATLFQRHGVDNSIFLVNGSLSQFEAENLIHSLLTEVLWFLDYRFHYLRFGLFFLNRSSWLLELLLNGLNLRLLNFFNNLRQPAFG
jgi:hypothetical protein